jgi:hypothetical protein
MKPLNLQELQAMGLKEESLQGEPQRATPAPTAGVGLGAAPRPGPPDARWADRLGQFARQPRTLDVTLPLLAAHIPQVQVSRWVQDPALVFIELPPELVSTRHVGPCRALDARSLAVDGHDGRCLVLLETGTVAVLLSVEGSHIDAQLVVAPAARQAFTPSPDAAPLPALDVDSVLGGVSTEPWLRAQAEALAAMQGHPRVAAAGMLGRFWRPPRATPRDVLAEVAAMEAGPLGRADAWLKALSPAQRDGVESDAIQAALGLDVALGTVEAQLDDPEGPRLGLEWLLHRDDLESTARQLERLGMGVGLRETLHRLDQAAAARHSMWAGVLLPEHPREEVWARDSSSPWWTLLGGDR